MPITHQLECHFRLSILAFPVSQCPQVRIIRPLQAIQHTDMDRLGRPNSSLGRRDNGSVDNTFAKDGRPRFICKSRYVEILGRAICQAQREAQRLCYVPELSYFGGIQVSGEQPSIAARQTNSAKFKSIYADDSEGSHKALWAEGQNLKDKTFTRGKCLDERGY